MEFKLVSRFVVASGLVATLGGCGAAPAESGPASESSAAQSERSLDAAPRPVFAAPFPEPRLYVRELFETPEQCEEAQKEWGVNCEQFVQFCPEGRAYVMFTDIMNIADYVVSGSTAEVTWKGPSEVGQGTALVSLFDDGKSLAWSDGPDAPRWHLREGVQYMKCQ